jgi:hypothetical protein
MHRSHVILTYLFIVGWGAVSSLVTMPEEPNQEFGGAWDVVKEVQSGVG